MTRTVALTTGTAKLMLANEAGTAGTEELQIGGLLKEGTYTFLKGWQTGYGAGKR